MRCQRVRLLVLQKPVLGKLVMLGKLVVLAMLAAGILPPATVQAEV